MVAYTHKQHMHRSSISINSSFFQHKYEIEKEMKQNDAFKFL